MNMEIFDAVSLSYQTRIVNNSPSDRRSNNHYIMEPDCPSSIPSKN